jgi:excisionase family DNA binding protein
MSLCIQVELSDEALTKLAQQVAELNGSRDNATWLDVKGAAEHLCCGKNRIYHLVSARKIPFHKDGSRTLFDRAEIDAWVRAGGGVRP